MSKKTSVYQCPDFVFTKNLKRMTEIIADVGAEKAMDLCVSSRLTKVKKCVFGDTDLLHESEFFPPSSADTRDPHDDTLEDEEVGTGVGNCMIKLTSVCSSKVKCFICDEEFADSSLLFNHRKLQHNMRTPGSKFLSGYRGKKRYHPEYLGSVSVKNTNKKNLINFLAIPGSNVVLIEPGMQKGVNKYRKKKRRKRKQFPPTPTQDSTATTTTTHNETGEVKDTLECDQIKATESVGLNTPESPADDEIMKAETPSHTIENSNNCELGSVEVAKLLDTNGLNFPPDSAFILLSDQLPMPTSSRFVQKLAAKRKKCYKPRDEISKSPNFPCGKCSETFKTASAARRHMKMIHNVISHFSVVSAVEDAEQKQDLEEGRVEGEKRKKRGRGRPPSKKIQLLPTTKVDRAGTAGQERIVDEENLLLAAESLLPPEKRLLSRGRKRVSGGFSLALPRVPVTPGYPENADFDYQVEDGWMYNSAGVPVPLYGEDAHFEGGYAGTTLVPGKPHLPVVIHSMKKTKHIDTVQRVSSQQMSNHNHSRPYSFAPTRPTLPQPPPSLRPHIPRKVILQLPPQPQEVLLEELDMVPYFHHNPLTTIPHDNLHFHQSPPYQLKMDDQQEIMFSGANDFAVEEEVVETEEPLNLLESGAVLPLKKRRIQINVNIL